MLNGAVSGSRTISTGIGARQIFMPRFDPGAFLALVAENLCELGNQFVQYVADNTKADPANVVMLGGTPGNGLSAAWQKCSASKLSWMRPRGCIAKRWHFVKRYKLMKSYVGFQLRALKFCTLSGQMAGTAL